MIYAQSIMEHFKGKYIIHQVTRDVAVVMVAAVDMVTMVECLVWRNDH